MIDKIKLRKRVESFGWVTINGKHVLIGDKEGKRYNEGKPYLRYASAKSPMSDWGHAMFAANQEHLEGPTPEGMANYEFTPRLGDAHVVESKEVENKAVDIWKKWKEDGVPDQYEQTDIGNLIEEHDPADFPDLAKSFSPQDIVDSAGAYDNGDWTGFVYDQILEPNEWGAIITPDGAIVFDEKMIKRRK